MSFALSILLSLASGICQAPWQTAPASPAPAESGTCEPTAVEHAPAAPSPSPAGPRCALDGTDDDPSCALRAPLAPAPHTSLGGDGESYLAPAPRAPSGPAAAVHRFALAASHPLHAGHPRRVDRPPRLSSDR